MKKLLMILAITVFSAQGGYCAGSALETLQKLGDVENVSVPVPAVEAMAGNKLAAAGTLRMSGLAGATEFEKLKNLFNEGVPAVKEDLIGWHYGRVVDHKSPQVFMASLLIVKETRTGGPLFSGEYGVSVITSDHLDYFDNMSNGFIEFLDAYSAAGGIYGPIKLPEATARHLQFRKAGGYVVERHFEVITGTLFANDGYYESYAYYFQNVTPKK